MSLSAIADTSYTVDDVFLAEQVGERSAYCTLITGTVHRGRVVELEALDYLLSMGEKFSFTGEANLQAECLEAIAEYAETMVKINDGYKAKTD